MPPKNSKPLKIRITKADRLETRLMSSGPQRDSNFYMFHSGNGPPKIVHLRDPSLKRPASPPESSKKARRKKTYQSQVRNKLSCLTVVLTSYRVLQSICSASWRLKAKSLVHYFPWNRVCSSMSLVRVAGLIRCVTLDAWTASIVFLPAPPASLKPTFVALYTGQSSMTPLSGFFGARISVN